MCSFRFEVSHFPCEVECSLLQPTALPHLPQQLLIFKRKFRFLQRRKWSRRVNTQHHARVTTRNHLWGRSRSCDVTKPFADVNRCSNDDVITRYVYRFSTKFMRYIKLGQWEICFIESGINTDLTDSTSTLNRTLEDACTQTTLKRPPKRDISRSLSVHDVTDASMQETSSLMTSRRDTSDTSSRSNSGILQESVTCSNVASQSVSTNDSSAWNLLQLFPFYKSLVARFTTERCLTIVRNFSYVNIIRKLI